MRREISGINGEDCISSGIVYRELQDHQKPVSGGERRLRGKRLEDMGGSFKFFLSHKKNIKLPPKPPFLRNKYSRGV